MSVPVAVVSTRLEAIERRADQAAKLVHPLLIAGTRDQIELAHDLLNHLAAIRLQAGMIREDVRD